jgi:AmiR/NasT family two-component response regulator
MTKLKQTAPQLLLVDDEPIVLNTLANGLDALNYKVTTFDSPDGALESYKHNPPDLVILDYRMPEMTGLELAKAMISIVHRPIIMLSAYNDLPLVREAVGAGITTYLVKPVEAERVAPSIEAALARFAEITALLQQGANIQAGVESHRLINTAVGIVMARTNRPQDQAFESLRRLARDQRRPLRDLALDLVDATSTSNSIISQLHDIA